MAKTDYKKDIKNLVKIVRKLGRKSCDRGTYDEREKKHLVIEFLYKTKRFWHSFPLTPSSFTSVKKNYAAVKRKLNDIGLDHPKGIDVRMSKGIDELDGILRDIHDLLDSVIPHREETSPSVRLYLNEVEKLNPTRTKPYKKKISYITKTRKEVGYDRYYVFGRKLGPYGIPTDGFVSVRKDTFVEALMLWKEINRSK